MQLFGRISNYQNILNGDRYKWQDKAKIEFHTNFFDREYIGDEFFKKINSPIFIQIRNKEYRNIKLKDIEFSKYMDATTCFNEISFYLSNNLRKEKEIVNISNEEKIVKNGFSKRSSFRNV